MRITLLFLLCTRLIYGQDCTITLSGNVTDLSTDASLEAVTIYLEKAEKGTISDVNGLFEINNVCPGSYHLVFSHIGCESQRVFLEITMDTTLNITMEHTVHVLHGATVTGQASPMTTQNTQSINEQNISDHSQENLAGLLEDMAGVQTLKNGNNIAKPIIHGLYGNRITILNNGIAQSGQQWGNDHSPEIDPLIARRVRVLKGVSALEYIGSNLGGIVLVDPGRISNEPHLHGKASYAFNTNGRGHTGNIQLQQYSDIVAWKFTATAKRSGDLKSSSYYLNNTGNNELNFALQLEKSFSDKISSELYISTFNTDIGILRGSHIGNLSDLDEAFIRDTPFFTEEDFSYTIDAPKQDVTHHLAKLSTKIITGTDNWLHFTLAGQVNLRKEFDVRRSGRSDIPALSLKQFSYFAEGKYHHSFSDQLRWKTGLQINISDNTNDPETGILPLIPDYVAFESGWYSSVTYELDNGLIEGGLRYDYIYQNVVTISQSTPREILRFNKSFHNLSSSFGYTHQLNGNLSLSTNLGFATRNPAINELYSGGLHQGVSGIEEGNVDLDPEKSVKATIGLKGEAKEVLGFEALVYYQNIRDYIFLSPQNETRLTIRGAFPVFRYEQTNARIYGLDLTGRLRLAKNWESDLTYSFIRGDDLTNDLPLINMPTNNLRVNLKWELPKWNLGFRGLENTKLELENQYVFRQNHLLPQQDFVLPPDAYNLVHFGISTEVPMDHLRLRLVFRIENLLNTSYRSYLNRLRYFADDTGINASLGASLKF